MATSTVSIPSATCNGVKKQNSITTSSTCGYIYMYAKTIGSVC